MNKTTPIKGGLETTKCTCSMLGACCAAVDLTTEATGVAPACSVHYLYWKALFTLSDFGKSRYHHIPVSL